MADGTDPAPIGTDPDPVGPAPRAGKHFAATTPGAGDGEPRVPKWVVRTLMAVLAVLAVLLVIGLAWLADSSLAGDDTATRGATVAGRDVGGMSDADIHAAVAEMIQHADFVDHAQR